MSLSSSRVTEQCENHSLKEHFPQAPQKTFLSGWLFAKNHARNKCCTCKFCRNHNALLSSQRSLKIIILGWSILGLITLENSRGFESHYGKLSLKWSRVRIPLKETLIKIIKSSNPTSGNFFHNFSASLNFLWFRALSLYCRSP